MTIYISDKMLFNYSHCKCCKNGKDKVKFAFTNILPVNVCDTIGEYNISCDKCCKFRDGEEQFMKKNKSNEKSKFQLQIKCCLKMNEWRKPISFYYKIGKKHFDKDVDKFFSDDRLGIRFGRANIHIKPYKAFIKKHRALFGELNYWIDCPQGIKQTLETSEINSRCFFDYYSSSYPVIDIIYAFLAEYIIAIVGYENLHYIGGKVKILNYVDDVLDEFIE